MPAFPRSWHLSTTRPSCNESSERRSSNGLRAVKSHEVRRFQRIETSERAAPGNHRVSIRFWRRLSARGSPLRAAKIAGRRRQNLLDPRAQRTHETRHSRNESSERWSSSGLRAAKSHEVRRFQRIETSERAAPGHHRVSIRFWRRLAARESPLRAPKIAGRRRQNLLDPRAQRTHRTRLAAWALGQRLQPRFDPAALRLQEGGQGQPLAQGL